MTECFYTLYRLFRRVMPLESADCRRAIYVVAHRCNDLSSAESALRNGANAIECDVRSQNNGREWFVDHDVCASWSTPFSSWLRATAAAFARHPAGCLIVLDIKTPEANFIQLLDEFDQQLPDDVDVVLSFSSVANYDRGRLATPLWTPDTPKSTSGRRRFMVQIDQDRLGRTLTALRREQLSWAWASFGTCTVCPGDEQVHESARAAIRVRDNADLVAGTPNLRVGVWTYTRPDSIRFVLVELGVDAVTVAPDAVRAAVTVVDENNLRLTARRTMAPANARRV